MTRSINTLLSNNPLAKRLKALFERWVNQRLTRMGNKIVLNNRSIYVVPTRFGYILAAILLILLLNAMNYENSMAFMLTFLLTGIALLGMNYTYSNMAGLILSPAKNKSVFAGDRAILSFNVENPKTQLRQAFFR